MTKKKVNFDWNKTIRKLNDINKNDDDVPCWKKELEKVQQCPQRQDGLRDQLNDLRIIANKFGFYDAADYLRED